MSSSARTVLIFGIYLIVLGLVLVVAPNFLLSVFAIPSTHEVWIRVVGMLVLFLGILYSQAARNEFTELLRWTAYLRGSVILFFCAFVLLGLAPPQLLLFGVVDLLGAAWTAYALRSTEHADSAKRAPTALQG